MNKLFLFFAILLALCSKAQTTTEINSRKIRLPNGWYLSPVGKSLPLGDLPLNIAVSANKQLMAVSNNGQSTQSIQLIDVKTEKILDSITIPKSWYGLQFSADDKFLYASGGNDNWILKYTIAHNKLVINDTIKLGSKWP
ncbi:MAG: hypothetical protein H7334_09925, partial [Ferruginibacter sp.]|nr:hypothetical protein [Ferruginibacter sp.]